MSISFSQTRDKCELFVYIQIANEVFAIIKPIKNPIMVLLDLFRTSFTVKMNYKTSAITTAAKVTPIAKLLTIKF